MIGERYIAVSDLRKHLEFLKKGNQLEHRRLQSGNYRACADGSRK